MVMATLSSSNIVTYMEVVKADFLVTRLDPALSIEFFSVILAPDL